MKKFLDKVMKRKVATIIKILGIGLTELIIDLELDTYTFNSIEWVQSENKIYLHIFEEDDLDITYDFDDLSDDEQLSIYVTLSSILYN